MQFDTYASLQSAIADELNRTDLTSAITGFISLMESQTERQLRVREMIEYVPAFEVATALEPIPADFLETRSFVLNTVPVTPLRFMTIDDVAQFDQANEGVGKPLFFTIIGDNFRFSKTPDDTYTATLIYYKQIPRLSDVVTTNWLLTKHPDIYFYGSLLNSAPYLKEDPRVQVWAGLYQNAVNSLQNADERAQTQSNNLVAKSRKF